MRIIVFILKFAAILLIVGLIGLLIGREVLMAWAVSGLKRSLSVLRVASLKGTGSSECYSRGAELVRGTNTITYQLRFLNDTQYQVEAVCDQFSNAPIIIERGALPSMVSKVPGYSGFYWKQRLRTGIQVAVLASMAQDVARYLPIDPNRLMRKQYVVVDNEIIVSSGAETGLQDGPVTSCEGYGYQCCQAATQVGIGDQITGLAECKDSCFATCSSRPAILSFTSNPFFDARSRTLEVEAGNLVDFMYVSDGKSNEKQQAVLDFGDGAQAKLDGTQGSSSHTYSCDKTECRYTAYLKIIDEWGVESALSALSQITVIVRTP